MNKEEKLKEGSRLLRKHLSKSATRLKTAKKVVQNDSLSTSLQELTSVKSNSTLPSTKGLREISKELNGLVSQPLLEVKTKSSPARYNTSPSPSFLSSGDYPVTATNGAEINYQSYNGATETERKLWANEKESLQKQIQAHTETVNMLVSEKTSLQTQLNHLQKELSDRTREHSKTQTDLQACQLRLRTADEEREKLAMKRSQHEQEMKSLSEQLAHTQRELQQAKYDLDERKQENTEMTSKLTLQAAELLQVQTSNAELQAKLKMAELLTQQLSEGTVPTSSEENPLQEEQFQRLSNEIEQCKSTISRVTAERDRALTEVRQLSTTLHEQEKQYNQQCTVLQQQWMEQKDQLDAANKIIASVQSEKDTSLLESNSQFSQLQEATQAQIEQFQAEVLHLKAQLEQEVKNNANLSKLNTEQEDVVVKLEGQLSRLKEQSVDHQQLLDTITNDKETISRVLVQNNELKNQLAELQDGFVKMSQQNMELASELHSERHNYKELSELYKKEQEENSQLSQQLSSLQYEDDVKQSQDATDFVGDLPNEDEGLTFSLPPVVSSTPPPIVQENEELIKQLQAEKDAMAVKLATLTEEHARVTAQLHQQEEKETDVQAPQEEDKDEAMDAKHIVIEESHEHISPQNVAQLQTNFVALQDRFTQLMTEKADLLDQLQRYEHINVQLENETETIGEYIVLYQKQRESLKKKSEQKDRFITQLIGEKETLQGKLVELQDLVRQLLNEQHQKQQIHEQSIPRSVTTVIHSIENSGEAHIVTTDLENISKASTPESILLLENPNLEIATNQQHSTNTANQILTLLHEIESSNKTHHQLIIPCHCCVGELISV